jgi:hypothetical protein
MNSGSHTSSGHISIAYMPRPGLAANLAELKLGGPAAGTANIGCLCSSQLIEIAGHMGGEGPGICD